MVFLLLTLKTFQIFFSASIVDFEHCIFLLICDQQILKKNF